MCRTIVSLYILLICSIFNLNVAGVTQDYYWRDYVPGDIPCDAIVAAPGKYIGQVNHAGNLVAMIYAHSRTAVTELAGKNSFTENIKILCSHRLDQFFWDWVDFDNPSDLTLENIVRGGYQDHLKHDLFIGKVYHENEWKVGKVVADLSHVNKGIWIWDKDGKTIRLSEFKILKTRGPGAECHLTNSTSVSL